MSSLLLYSILILAFPMAPPIARRCGEFQVETSNWRLTSWTYRPSWNSQWFSWIKMNFRFGNPNKMLARLAMPVVAKWLLAAEKWPGNHEGGLHTVQCTVFCSSLSDSKYFLFTKFEGLLKTAKPDLVGQKLAIRLSHTEAATYLFIQFSSHKFILLTSFRLCRFIRRIRFGSFTFAVESTALILASMDSRQVNSRTILAGRKGPDEKTNSCLLGSKKRALTMNYSLTLF